jgi:hypothetical protein
MRILNSAMIVAPPRQDLLIRGRWSQAGAQVRRWQPVPLGAGSFSPCMTRECDPTGRSPDHHRRHGQVRRPRERYLRGLMENITSTRPAPRWTTPSIRKPTISTVRTSSSATPVRRGSAGRPGWRRRPPAQARPARWPPRHGAWQSTPARQVGRGPALRSGYSVSANASRGRALGSSDRLVGISDAPAVLNCLRSWSRWRSASRRLGGGLRMAGAMRARFPLRGRPGPVPWRGP